ncbi:uncharacterized protein KY384_000373 [Bacidia gigantensis]|uniref:uncharacterized protein n=1 Tax=Bacidia gigantensis TaxID=2732470 RepID=UPI001D051F00|nr:uncharacterized protein KY384_000373 [Bacidia gigantensis]KAG8526380.1 hypothetical protein KY384_000373 [Bacidia gigantensis]
MTLFAAAGVFSSEVAKAAGNETLVRSSNCGYLLPDLSPTESNPVNELAANAQEANETLAADAYSRACYGSVQDALQCNQYPRAKIPWTTTANVSCPFDQDLCWDGPTSAFKIESGLIDSHYDLGINSKRLDRLQHRKATTCSVLHTKDHAYQTNETDENGDPVRIARYTFGGFGASIDEGTANTTFIYNLHGNVGTSGYALVPFVSYSGQAQQTWYPIPELNRTDADVTIMFLAPNTVSYLSPVYDPWFHATTPTNLSSGDLNMTNYLPDYTVGVLACADQFQLCNPVNNKCTNLTAVSTLQNESRNLLLNEVQAFTLTDIFYTMVNGRTYNNVQSRGANSLRVTDTLSGSTFTQIGLPDNQWTIEVTNLFAVSMARMQQEIINYATGPSYSSQGLEFVKGEKTICERQKIRSASGYISFSVLGVSIILVLGTLEWGADAVPVTRKGEMLEFAGGENSGLEKNGYRSAQRAEEHGTPSLVAERNEGGGGNGHFEGVGVVNAGEKTRMLDGT